MSDVEFETIEFVRPTEFASDHEWAQSAMHDKWEAEEAAGSAEATLATIQRALGAWRQDAGKGQIPQDEIDRAVEEIVDAAIMADDEARASGWDTIDASEVRVAASAQIHGLLAKHGVSINE